MRLIRCRLESVRRHRSLEVTFSPGLTLIGGANESGKSSLVEAMHRTLFVRAASTGAVIRDLRSATHAGHPEVEIDFDASGHSWSLLKCFSGAGGTCRLSRAGQIALLGADAEDQLASLLGVEEIIGSRQVNRVLPTRWAHLWVMQGLAGRNLLELNAEHYDLKGLITALEGQAEESLQSPMDQNVYDQLESLVSASMTSRGVKQNSDLWRRRQELQQASQRHVDAQQQLSSYESACFELEANERALDELHGSAPELQRLRKQYLALKDLQQRLAPLRLQQKQWQQELDGLHRLRKEIHFCDKRIASLRIELDAISRSVTIVSDKRSDQRRSLESLDRKRQSLEERGQTLRRHLDQERLAGRIQALRRYEKQRAELEHQLAVLQAQLKELPGGDAQSLSALQARQHQLRELEIRVQSMASRIELQCSEQSVRLDGNQLSPGDVVQRTGAFRLEVGSDVTLVVSPGEGIGLSALLAEQERCQHQLSRDLATWGASSVQEAERQLQSRHAAQQQLALLDAQLRQLVEQGLNENDPSNSLEEMTKQLVELQQESHDSGVKDADDLEQTLNDCRLTYRSVQDQLRLHQADLERTEQELATQERKLQECRIQLERQTAEQTQLEQQRQSIVERSGESDRIDADLATVSRECEQLQEMLISLCDDCQVSPGSDLTRSMAELDEREQMLDRRRTELNRERGALLERCDQLGRRELHAELEEAAMQLEVAELAERQEHQLVNARVQLLKRFQDARADLSRRYSSPLKASINHFIAPLLRQPGDSTELRFDAKDGLRDLRLQRSGQSMEFSQLSGGLKEQLNAAVRLAMAQTLSAAHDGCLPLLFDDAFTNTDPERLAAVRCMLRRAVDVGLQVVILSCDPDPYLEIADAVVDLNQT